MFFCLGSQVAANDFSVKTNKKIIWESAKSDIKLSAELLDDNVFRIVISLNDKLIITNINSQTKTAHMVEGTIKDSSAGVFTKKDSEDLNHLFKIMLESNLNSFSLGNTLLRFLNLLDSWPTGMPLEFELEGGPVIPGNSINAEPSFIDLCEKINRLHDGEYPIEGVPTPFFDIEVGPYPWDFGDCVGRCGKQCAGDGKPDNGMYVYSQDCFDHDVCVEDQWMFDPDCNSIFDSAIDDFLFGPSCQKDNIDLLVNNQDGPVDIVNDELDIKASIYNTFIPELGFYYLYAETSLGFFSWTINNGWQFNDTKTPFIWAPLWNFSPYPFYTGPLPNGFPTGKSTFYFAFRYSSLYRIYEDAVEVNVSRPAITFETTFGGTDDDGDVQ